MLNVNAKSFVPPGAEAPPPPSLVENIYRYRIDVAPQRAVDMSINPKTISAVSSLLTSKYLFGDRGPRDEDTLRYFLSEAFLSVTNLPVMTVTEKSNSGFMLSKALLALYSEQGAISTLNDARGFLVRIDVPREFAADVNTVVSATWGYIFDRFLTDSRVSAFGYSHSVAGLNETKTGGSYRHYFYVACNQAYEGDPLTAKDFTSLHIPISRVTQVSSIIPFACGFRCPLAIFVTVGDEAKKLAFPRATPADFEYELEYFTHDYARTKESTSAFEAHYLSLLNGNHKWERTHALHLHINFAAAKYKNDALPFWDILFFVGCLCDDTGTVVGGVSLSAPDCAPGSQRVFALNQRGPFYLNATLAGMAARQFSFDTTHAIFGNIPLHLCRCASVISPESVSRVVAEYVPAAKKAMFDRQRLTRMNFAEAAEQFAKHHFFVRRRAIGASVLFGTDSSGNHFGVDLKTESVFALRSSTDGQSGLARDCLFTATLCSTSRGHLDYRLIIDDILTFQNTDVRGRSFAERWRCVENMDLSDEESWPHTTISHLAVLRAGYVPFESTEFLVKLVPTDFATSGIVFVDDTASASNKDFGCSQFSWVSPTALTLRFSINRIEAAPEDHDELNRLFLSAAESHAAPNTFVPYEGEFVDVQSEAHDNLKAGCIIECILRRAEDGAHWWDVVREFDAGTESVSTFAEIDQLIHSPGITKEEMLWLLKAPTYQCERCDKVNDAGRFNSVRNVYWCNNCWRETGHGECSYCNRNFTTGMVDGASKLFYCGSCWTSFSTANSQAELGYHVPPPPNATFGQQVVTRCISLLIDYMNIKCPSNDVLDLCCGGSVVRKWMRNKTMRYVGIDLKTSVVDAMNDVIASAEGEIPGGAKYEAVCADAFSEDFWSQAILTIHPRQFHVVSCFVGLHHAFSDEERARRFVARIANALVPGGVFIGFSTDASVLYNKGLSFENSLMKVEWDEDSVPRIAHSFTITTEAGLAREENVVPVDFLVAVASEYGLAVISEACLTFRELIEKDSSWTKVPSADEKDYLLTLRTFAFKKEGVEVAPTEVRAIN